MRAAIGVFICAVTMAVVLVPSSAPSDGVTPLVLVPSAPTQLLVETLDGTVTRTITIPADSDFDQTGYSIASDGTVAYDAYDRGGSIWVARPNGTVTRIDASPRDASPSITYDGSKIAFSSDDSDGSSDIYVINADGTGLKEVASGGGTNELASPSFSPDGSTIAYVCGPITFQDTSLNCGPQLDGKFRNAGIMLMNADGSDKRMIVQQPGVLRNLPETLAWSPNGRWLAMEGLFPAWLNGYQTAYWRICVYPSDGSGLFWGRKGGLTRNIDDAQGSYPSISPDSTQILYFGNTGAHPGPTLIDRNGGNEHPLNLTSGWGWDMFPKFVPPAVGGLTPATVDATHVVVPDLRGVRYLPARKRLLRMHMSMGLLRWRHSPTVARGRVISERPRPGTRLHRIDGAKPPVDFVLSLGRRR